MEGMTERMEVLETEYKRMGKEIETLKQEKEIAQYEKPRTLNIRSELWNLFLRAWNEYFKDVASDMEPEVIANSVLTNYITKVKTTSRDLWKY